MAKRHVLTVCLISVAALLASVAQADDFAPPPWVRGDPLTTSVEWEFLTSASSHIPPDGTTVPTIGGDFTGPPAATIFSTPTPFWSLGDGDGEWSAGIAAISMEFEIGNWISANPLKYVRIQVTFDGPAPYVSSFNAIDGAAFVPGVLTGSTLFSTTHILIEYELSPSPDFELITLTIPAGGSVDQVVIDTLSVPEPATLLVMAAAGLAILRRRSR